MTIKRYNLLGVECFDGDMCLWSDVEPIISENSDLRARLAVYEDGRPTTEQLSQTTTEIVFAVDEGAPNKISLCLTADWLRRIASANEVPNDKP